MVLVLPHLSDRMPGEFCKVAGKRKIGDGIMPEEDKKLEEKRWELGKYMGRNMTPEILKKITEYKKETVKK